MLLIQASRDVILKPLQAVCGIVERRQAQPILSNVLIERNSDRLSFIATDIDIQITTQTASDSPGQNYALTVGARKLQDILRSLPENLEVGLLVQEKRLQIKAGKGKFSLQTLPAEDFPKLSAITGEVTKLAIKQKELKELFSLVSYAMAQQDIRYYLNGLLTIIDGTELKLVATDGHRLAYASIVLNQPGSNRVQAIIPRKTILELLKLLSESEENVDIDLSATQARFSFSGVALVTKLIDGKYPDYERVIPKGHTKNILVNRNVLLQALQRVAILTSDKFKGTRFILSEGVLKIACTNTEQEEAQEEIEVNYQGEALDIGFNVTYLLDVLTNLSNETVEISLGDVSSSALVTLPGRDNFKYVVMPMRI